MGADQPAGVGGHRGQEHDPAEAPLEHPGEGPLGEQEGSREVDRQRALPVLQGDLEDAGRGAADAGVGDQHVHPAEPALDLGDDPRRGVGVGEVPADRDRPPSRARRWLAATSSACSRPRA